METNRGAAAESSSTPTTRRYLSDVALHDIARVPDHRLTPKYIFEEFGITKRQLLRAYVTMELEESNEPTGTLCQWIERTFSEDLRTAIIAEGQERAIDGYNNLAAEMNKLNRNILDLVSELKIARKPATTALHQV